MEFRGMVNEQELYWDEDSYDECCPHNIALQVQVCFVQKHTIQKGNLLVEGLFVIISIYVDKQR